jgi:anti-sigma B factor antagonist
MDRQEHLALPVVVSAPAEIDINNAMQLGAAVVAANGRCPTVVLDMSQTVFCDSAGIHALVQAHKRVKAGGGQVRLVITTAFVLGVFALTGVDQLFPIFASLPDAVADGHQPPAAPGQLEIC